MKLLIEIDKGLYERIKCLEPHKNDMLDTLMRAVQKGIPLPEHHGRLLILDADRVNANLMKVGDWSCQEWISEVGISNSVVKIIPATKEGESE